MRVGASQDERRGFRRLLQHLEQQVDSLPVHGLRLVDDEYAPLELERPRVSDVPHLADLLDQDVARDRLDELKVKVHQTFDSPRGIFDLPPARRILARRHQHLFCLATTSAFSAKVVFEALAVQGLRQHQGQRLLAHALRSRKQKRARHATGGQHASHAGHRLRVAQEFAEAHVCYRDFRPSAFFRLCRLLRNLSTALAISRATSATGWSARITRTRRGSFLAMAR